MAKILVEKPDGLVGNEIRFLRKHAGLSGQELAALLDDDVTLERVSRVERPSRVQTRRIRRPTRSRDGV